jgi:inorganic pyrophosphatase
MLDPYNIFVKRYNKDMNIENSKSLELAKEFLGKEVEVTVDRQLGTKHPKWNFIYGCNYGFIKGIKAPDGEDLDAYVLKVDKPVEQFSGKTVAIIHRLENDDDKLIVIPKNETVSDEEIEKTTEFQEKWFKHEIIR